MLPTEILLAALGLLVSIVGFFVVKTFNKVDAMWDKVIAIEEAFKNFRDDVGYVRHVKNDMESKFEDLIILKRDQASIWKKIDEMRVTLGASH